MARLLSRPREIEEQAGLGLLCVERVRLGLMLVVVGSRPRGEAFVQEKGDKVVTIASSQQQQVAKG